MKNRIVFLLIVLALPISHGETIRVLHLSSVQSVVSIGQEMSADPSIEMVGVPCRAEGLVAKGADPTELMKFIRIYFPRRSHEMKSFDVIILNGAEYQLFTPEQDMLMYDAIIEGSGGINSLSVLSADPEINHAWAYSQTSTTFPNDAEWVADHDGGRQLTMFFRLEVNRDFPDPVLTPFIPYGFEDITFDTAGRLVRPPQGARVLAWQVGNHLVDRAPFLSAWDYEGGRTVTCGSGIGGNDIFGLNPYPVAGSVLMNLILYTARKGLIEDAAVYNRLRSTFSAFKTKVALLLSLRDFVDSFGANTEGLQREIQRLEGMYEESADLYRNQEFQKSEEAINSALKEFPEVEDYAREVKDRALLWVYVIEWLVTFSALFVSGFIVWTLMVRRRLYREVRATRFDTSDIDE